MRLEPISPIDDKTTTKALTADDDDYNDDDDDYYDVDDDDYDNDDDDYSGHPLYLPRPFPPLGFLGLSPLGLFRLKPSWAF